MFVSIFNSGKIYAHKRWYFFFFEKKIDRVDIFFLEKNIWHVCRLIIGGKIFEFLFLFFSNLHKMYIWSAKITQKVLWKERTKVNRLVCILSRTKVLYLYDRIRGKTVIISRVLVVNLSFTNKFTIYYTPPWMTHYIIFVLLKS